MQNTRNKDFQYQLHALAREQKELMETSFLPRWMGGGAVWFATHAFLSIVGIVFVICVVIMSFWFPLFSHWADLLIGRPQ